MIIQIHKLILKLIGFFKKKPENPIEHWRF